MSQPPPPPEFRDPAFEALLDDALAPGPKPDGLDDRIAAATADRLPRPGEDDLPDRPAVVGRIGGEIPWRPVAAAVVLALLLGGVWLAKPLKTHEIARLPTDPPTPANASTVAAVEVAAGLQRLADAEQAAEPIDDRIAWLSTQVAWADDATRGIWTEDALDSLDTAIARDQLDAAVDELDLYF